jgi:NarL family two-component system response regulator LiaR
MNNDLIRIQIADDHAVVRKGLRTLISAEPGMKLVGEACDGCEVIALAQKLEPDVILMDLVMPRKNGIEAIHEIKSGSSQARILVLTSFMDDDKVFPAIKAGASGYLLKDSLPEELLQSIRDINQGKPSLHPAIAEKLMKEFTQRAETPASPQVLTEREIEVLRMVAQGLDNQQIANRLVVSVRTVSTHISNILDKLHLANRTQAALFALREGLANLFEG